MRKRRKPSWERKSPGSLGGGEEPERKERKCRGGRRRARKSRGEKGRVLDIVYSIMNGPRMRRREMG
eukprot:627918-Hanusia_phi.AAC.1